jgi:hypothetical protein
MLTFRPANKDGREKSVFPMVGLRASRLKCAVSVKEFAPILLERSKVEIRGKYWKNLYVFFIVERCFLSGIDGERTSGV